MPSVVTAFLTQKGIRTKGEGKTAGMERLTYYMTYQVQTDDPQTQPDVVYSYFRKNSTLPYFGRKFRFNGKTDAGAICSEFNVDYIEKSEGRFLAEFTFTPIEGGDEPDTRPADTEEGELVEDPLQWQKEISITSSQSSFPVQESIFRGFDPPNIQNPFLKDGLRTPPVNSAIVPFDPPPEFDRSFVILRVAKRWPSWDEDKMQKWRDLVNNEAFVINWPIQKFRMTIPKFRGRIKAINGSSQFDNGIHNWRVETELWVHPISWREQLADMGTVRRAAFGDPDGAGGTLSSDTVPNPGEPHHQQIKDADGYPLMQPVLFNGNGQPMPLGNAGGPKIPKPVWLNYQYYNEGSFHNCPNITDVVG